MYEREKKIKHPIHLKSYPLDPSRRNAKVKIKMNSTRKTLSLLPLACFTSKSQSALHRFPCSQLHMKCPLYSYRCVKIKYPWAAWQVVSDLFLHRMLTYVSSATPSMFPQNSTKSSWKFFFSKGGGRESDST